MPPINPSSSDPRHRASPVEIRGASRSGVHALPLIGSMSWGQAEKATTQSLAVCPRVRGFVSSMSACRPCHWDSPIEFLQMHTRFHKLDTRNWRPTMREWGGTVVKRFLQWGGSRLRVCRSSRFGCGKCSRARTGIFIVEMLGSVVKSALSLSRRSGWGGANFAAWLVHGPSWDGESGLRPIGAAQKRESQRPPNRIQKLV